MSPLMGLFVLVVLIGTTLIIVGLVTRKRTLVLIGAPAAALVVIWYIGASRAPNPEAEFARNFGRENLSAVSELKTLKPTFMDGHFISFHISRSDFETRIRRRFGADTEAPGALLQQQPLPEGWPKWIETASPLFQGEVLDRRVFVVYGPKEETAFASIEYAQW